MQRFGTSEIDDILNSKQKELKSRKRSGAANI
jgi:hypothetical protein